MLTADDERAQMAAVDPTVRARYLELLDFPSWLSQWVPPAPWAPSRPMVDLVEFPGARQVIVAATGRMIDLDDGSSRTLLPLVEGACDERRRPRRVEPGFQMGQQPTMEVPSPDGRWFLGHRDGDLLIRAAIDDRSVVIATSPGSEASWTAKDAIWSGDAGRVVSACRDDFGVPRLPIVWWLKPVEEVTWHPYARPGFRRPRTSWHVIDVRSRRRVDLDLEPYAEGECRPLRWRGDEVVFLARERGSWTQRLLLADSRTGQVRVAHEEDGQCVSVHAYQRAAAIAEAASRPLSGDDEFLWLTDRRGWGALEVRSFDGRSCRHLPTGDFPVERVLAVTDSAVFVAARSDPARPYDLHACRVDLDGSGWRQLTDQPGHHQVTVVGNGTHLVDVHSTVSRPPLAQLRSASDGRLVADLDAADVSRLDGMGWRPPEEFTVLAADGETNLWGVLYAPAGADDGPPRPLVEVIYGGPQVLAHPVEFTQSMFGWLAQALSALGFVTCVLDGRGTPGRSRAFHERGHGTFGQHEIDDHVAALTDLARTRPWIDLDRVGIVGASYGGYMATRAMLTAPSLYKVGVAINAGAGDVHHGSEHEWFLGHPLDNPSGYAASSNVALADRLEGHLLLIHGTSDVNVPVSSTFKMADAFARAQVPFDLVLLPDQGHAFTGKSLRYRWDVMADHLVEHLQP